MARQCLNCAGLAFLFCIMALPFAPARAQVLDGVPHLINYQGRLTDAGGDPVTDGEYLITFTIWSDSLSTAPTDRRWISPDCPVLVINGLFNWQLGSREPLPPWTITNYANLWLGIRVGDDPEIAPRTHLSSAPYAYKAWQADYAKYADSAGLVGNCPCDVRVGIVNGMGGFDVSFASPFAPGTIPKVFATAVLTLDDPGPSNLLKGMTPYAEISNVSNAGFSVLLKQYYGGGSMLTATADVRYIAVE
jgi:hypothetical protein